MNNLILFLYLCFSAVGVSQISFETIDNKSDCHACTGKLIVKKNNFVDTIQIGSWGKVNSDYYDIKILGKDYVVLKTSYFSMGVMEEGIFIYSTEKNNFMHEVFSKLYTTQKDSYTKMQNNALKCTRLKKNIDFRFKANLLIVDIDTTLAFLVEPDEDFTIISTGKKKEKYIIE